MGHKQTVLDRDEWDAALEQAKSDLVNLGTELMIAGKAGPVSGDHREKILAHLESLATVDQGYAWWAAHVYEQAFIPVIADNPYANLTNDLAARMKAKKAQPQEIAT